MTDLKFPTVHLNGTPGDSLRDQILDATLAIRKAIEALQMAMPHGRDYHMQSATAGPMARIQMCNRIVKLREVNDELSKIGVSICDH